MLENHIVYSSKTIRLLHYNNTLTVIEKIEKFGKSFNQLTIETVKAFY